MSDSVIDGPDPVDRTTTAIANCQNRNVRLKKLRRHIERLGTNIGGSHGCRICRHHGCTGCVGADAVLDPVGPPMNDTHLPVIHTEHVRANLCHDGLEALTDRSAAGHDLDLSAGMHMDSHPIGRPKPALLDIHGDAETDIFTRRTATADVALNLVPLETRKRLVQQRFIMSGIENDLVAQRHQRPLIRHFIRRNQVATPHLDPREPELARDGVHQPLAREVGLVPPRRAIRCRGRLVRQPEMPVHSEMRQTIGARQDAAGHIRNAGTMRADIGPLIVEEIVVDPKEPSLAVNRGTNAVTLLA